MDTNFAEVSLILVIATAMAGLMQLLRQPLIIGHILTGILIGPYFLNVIHSRQTLEVFSHIGIALLLFIIGLSLQPRVVKEVGRVSLVTGLGQIVFTSVFGFMISHLLGYSALTSLYIAIALTFSSTIIIMKLLSDTNELGRLHGKIATGFLLVQDLVATVILIAVSSVSEGKSLATMAGQTSLRLIMLMGIFAILVRFLLPRLHEFLGRSQEFLAMFAIGWGFGLAALFSSAGLSIEIGALFAGVALATSAYSHEIASRMRPLRDFFIVLFFILLGSQMMLENIGGLLWPALVFSGFILIGNPLIVMALMGLLGYTKKTSFKAGLTVAQISEFSLILVILGNRVGHLSQEIVSLVTVVGLVTIAASTYMIIYSDKLYGLLEKYLSLFERRKAKRDIIAHDNIDFVLFGYQKGGHEFVKTFKELGKNFIVVDYDPEIIDVLERRRIQYLYGDITDAELLEEAGVKSAKLVVSTVADISASRFLLEYLNKHNPDAVIIVQANTPRDAAGLYKQGASYVMLPHLLGSEQISGFVKKSELRKSDFKKFREQHLKYLQNEFGALDDAVEHPRLGKTIIKNVAKLTKSKA